MIDPIIIASATMGASALGALALRDVFARSAIQKACEEASPRLKQFKKDNVYVRPLDEQSLAVATVMRKTIQSSKELRESIITSLKDLKIPSPETPMDLPELQDSMVSNKGVYLKILKNTYTHKIQHVYTEQVKYRLDLAKKAAIAREAAKKAAEVGTIGLAGNAAISSDAAAQTADAISDQYETIAAQIDPHLDMFQEKIAVILEKSGLVDLSVEIIQKIDHFITENIGDIASDHAASLTEMLTHIHAFPGAVSGIKTAFNELQMFMESETSLEDMLTNGAIPIVLKSIFLKIGISIDTMFLGTTMGTFTVLSAVAAKFTSDSIFEMKIKTLAAELDQILNSIKACYQRTVRTMNEIAKEFTDAFSDKIETCPDINEEIVIVKFIDILKNSYSNGLRDAEKKLADNLKQELDNLPENTVLDKLLFIDRKSAVKRLFLEAHRDISSYHTSLVHEFNCACERHAEDGVDFLIKHVVFDTLETETVLGRMEDITLEVADDYTGSLNKWESAVTEFYKQRSQEVAKEMKEQRDIYEDFYDSQRPIIKSISRQIGTHRKRQGKSSPSLSFAQ
jgi:hypothetical protein